MHNSKQEEWESKARQGKAEARAKGTSPWLHAPGVLSCADSIYATKGQYLKRRAFKGRGHVTALISRRCHVQVSVSSTLEFRDWMTFKRYLSLFSTLFSVRTPFSFQGNAESKSNS